MGQAEYNLSEAGFDASFNKKKSIVYGLFLGFISLASGLVAMLIARDLQSFFAVVTVPFLINVGLFVAATVFFAILLRKKSGHFWSFSVALKSIYVMLAISTLISTPLTSVYVSFVNPMLQEEVINNTINHTIEFMENNNVPDEQIDEKIAEVEMQKENIGTFSFGHLIKGLAITLLVQFMFALVLAVILKRERPLFTSPNTIDGLPLTNE